MASKAIFPQSLTKGLQFIKYQEILINYKGENAIVYTVWKILRVYSGLSSRMI